MCLCVWERERSGIAKQRKLNVKVVFVDFSKAFTVTENTIEKYYRTLFVATLFTFHFSPLMKWLFSTLVAKGHINNNNCVVLKKKTAGAVVKLQCNNTKYKLVQTSKSDKNGYFYIEAPKSITTYGAHKCNVVLVSAPYGLKASNLHGGVTGALLRPEKPFLSKKLPFVLYTVGPLAFEPNCH